MCLSIGDKLVVNEMCTSRAPIMGISPTAPSGFLALWHVGKFRIELGHFNSLQKELDKTQ
jgi:hypothetical protein